MNVCVLGGLFVDGAVNTEKVAAIFSDSKTERILSEESAAVLESSIEKVGTESKVFLFPNVNINSCIPSTVKEDTSNQNYYVIFIFRVIAENFVNCPKLDETENCQELRGEVEECLEKNEIENILPGFSTPN